MIALALIALLLAAAAVVFIVTVGTGQDVAFTFFAGNFVTKPVWIFIGGAVTLLLAMAALALFRRGTRRKVAQRREIKRLRKVEETSTVPVTDAGTTRSGRESRRERDHKTHATHDTHLAREGHDHSTDRQVQPMGNGSDEPLVRETRRSPDGETRSV